MYTPDERRPEGRANNEMRPVKLTRDVMKNAHGSCLSEFGDTRVMCTATIEESLPAWRRASRKGWVTAEYAMLPASTSSRTKREYKGRKGRSMEIERLIGRSLRAVCDLDHLGEFTITVDCDVIQADGGTRTASITGAFVALVEACASFYEKGKIFPVKDFLSAISVGVSHEGVPILDLCYEEDSRAIVDMNVVMTGAGRFVEVQGTGEGRPFTHEELGELLALGEKGCRELISYEKDVLGGELVWLVGREG